MSSTSHPLRALGSAPSERGPSCHSSLQECNPPPQSCPSPFLPGGVTPGVPMGPPQTCILGFLGGTPVWVTRALFSGRGSALMRVCPKAREGHVLQQPSST